MCKVLKVSKSGYYKWINGKNSKRKLENEKLTEEIIKIYEISRKTYGRKKIQRELIKKGIKCSEGKVYRLMKKAGIVSIKKRKYKKTTDSNHNLQVAGNLLNQDFKANAPNEKWAGDISYIETREGWLYLAVVIDLFDRAVIGWAMESTMTKELVIKAINMAVRRRGLKKGLIFHSDRGSQYCSNEFKEKLTKYKINQSMSRKGNCYDNACVESFFGTLKIELIYTEDYELRQIAKSSIFEYIEFFYNTIRIHSSLDYKSPIEFYKSFLESAI